MKLKIYQIFIFVTFVMFLGSSSALAKSQEDIYKEFVKENYTKDSCDSYITTDPYQYGLYDINKDGTLELIIGIPYTYYENTPTVLFKEVYTLKNDVPISTYGWSGDFYRTIFSITDKGYIKENTDTEHYISNYHSGSYVFNELLNDRFVTVKEFKHNYPVQTQWGNSDELYMIESPRSTDSNKTEIVDEDYWNKELKSYGGNDVKITYHSYNAFISGLSSTPGGNDSSENNSGNNNSGNNSNNSGSNGSENNSGNSSSGNNSNNSGNNSDSSGNDDSNTVLKRIVLPSQIDLKVGNIAMIDSFVTPEELKSEIKVTSDNSSVVSVVSVNNGVITVKANKVGIAHIIATFKSDSSIKAQCTIAVAENSANTPSSGSNISGSNTQKVSIYRLYNNKTGEHLYTSDANEARVLSAQADWNDEGIGWEAPTNGEGVYRLYSPVTGVHLFTTDRNEVNVLSASGWSVDNGGKPLFYSGGSKSVYRLYSPALRMHLITTDLNEYNVLAGQGWNQEGVKLKAY